MPTNDLLPFALQVGANVLSQASYLGNTARLNGVSSGTASSPLANKTWRQAGFVTTMIGQFTMHNALEDVLDNADVDDFERKFKKAVEAVASAVGLRRAATGGTSTAATIGFGTKAFTVLNNSVLFLADVTTALVANATMNVDGLGARDLYRTDGTKIQLGDAPAGAVLLVVYDTTNTRLVVMNMTSYAIQSWSTNFGSTFGGTINAMTASLVPNPGQYRDGLRVIGRTPGSTANTVNPTMNLNGMGVKSLSTTQGTDFPLGEIKGTMLIEMIYNATSDKFVVVSSTKVPNASGFDSVKQPAFWAQNAFAAVGGLVSFFQSGFSLLYNKLGDATFNTGNGTVTIGPNTAGLWLMYCCNLSSTTVSDAINIQANASGAGSVSGLLATTTGDVNNAGGFSPYNTLAYMAPLASGQQVATTHIVRNGGYSIQTRMGGVRVGDLIS